MDPLTGELVERVDEVPAVAHGNDVSVLALCYGEGEQERACRFIAFALPERRGGQNFAFSVADDDMRGGRDIGVAVDSVACPIF